MHAWVFGAGVIALAGTNWRTGGPWWWFWPLAAWGVALAVHYLAYKARAVDERWAETRAADLHSKSYDASHIDSIAERYEVKGTAPGDQGKQP